MTITLEKQKYSIWDVTYIIFSFIIIVFFYNKGALYLSDSDAYINNLVVVLPMYPLTIDLFQFLFGDNGIELLSTFQIILCLSAIYFFINTMDKEYKINYVLKLLIFSILLIPVFKNGNYILTEAIGYSFSIIFLTFFIKAIIEKRLSYFVYILIFAMLLIRPQFKLTLIFLTVYFLIQVIFYDKDLKKFIISMLSIVFVYFMSNFAVVNYNKYYNGVDAYIKFEGTNYITKQLYISSVNSYKVIKEDDLRKSLKIVLEKIDKDKSSFKYFNNRCHFALGMSNLRKHFREEFQNDTYIEKYGNYDDIKKRIAFQLLWENKFIYIKYILKNAFTSTSLSIVFIFIIFFLSLYGMYKSKENIFKIVFFISLFSLMNNFLIYAVSRFQFRYLYYSDFILLAALVVFFYVLIEGYSKKITIKNQGENKYDRE